jgi:hypothetical protein
MENPRWLQFLAVATLLAVVGFAGAFVLTPDTLGAFVYEAAGIVVLALLVAYWVVLRRGDPVGVLMQ